MSGSSKIGNKSGSSTSYSVRYRFSQPFDFPAEMAYRWCIDFAPDDWARMGKEGTRKIARINEDALILTDTVVTKTEGKKGQGRRKKITKQRLVRIDPERMEWTNTHLTGPNKHSQFWYQIVAEDENRSRLDFTGLQINYYHGKRPSPEKITGMAAQLTVEDSGAWQLLAKEMQKDLLPSAYN